MSSLPNNATNRISTPNNSNNTTYLSGLTFNDGGGEVNNDCDGSPSSSPSNTATIGLTAMGLAAASLAASVTNLPNLECESKRNSTPLKLHANTSDDSYAAFYGLNRTLSGQSPSNPPCSNVSNNASPFNFIGQSSNSALQFANNAGGSFIQLL